MGRLRKSEKGFSIVEVALLIVVVACAGVAGWLVYKDHAANTPVATKTSQSANPYVGWKTATLKYEKLSFKYPAGWKLQNVSYAAGSPSVVCVHPGTDSATLKAPNGESVILGTGSACGGGSATQIASLPIVVLGKSYHVLLLDDNGAPPNNQPTEACLSTSASVSLSGLPGLPSRNIFMDSGKAGPPVVNYFCFQNKAASDASLAHRSVAAVEDDANFATAKLIFESLAY